MAIDDLIPEFVVGPEPANHGRIATGAKLGLQAGDALLVVDVQRDFLPGGALPVAGGNAVVQRLNAYIAAFDARRLPIFLTRDWHPSNHCSFRNNGGRWPEHCVQGAAGAEWPSGLQVPDSACIVSKGTDSVVEAYSGFAGTNLLELLRARQVNRLFVGGLATDYCVHDTVLDALKQGFAVALLANAVSAIDAEPGDATRAIRDMIERGAQIIELAPSHRHG